MDQTRRQDLTPAPDAFAKATEACKEFERLFGVTVDEFHQFRSRDVYELLSAQRSQEPADDE
jgi:hypothetical protein